MAKRKSARRNPLREAAKKKFKWMKDLPENRHEETGMDRVVVRPAGARGVGAARPRKRGDAAGGGGPEPGTNALRVKALAAMRTASEGMRGAATGRGPGDELTPPTPGMSNWVQLGPTAIPNGQTYGGARVLVTGRITAIALHPTDPNTIYVGTAQGGVWKTTDAGANWSAKSDNEFSLAIGALAIDPTNPQILYAGTGEANFSGDSYYGVGILKSTDGGTVWNLFGNPLFSGMRCSRIAIGASAPTRVLAGMTGANPGVFRSNDGGVTWAKLPGLPASGQVTDVVMDPSNANTVYAAIYGNGVYKSTNINAATPTWTKLATGFPATGAFGRLALGISASSPQTLYALVSNTGNVIDRFLITTNGGASWSSIALPGAGNIGGQGFYNIHVAVDPTTPDIVFLSGISLWKAVRNPSTGVWTITEVGANIHPDNHFAVVDPSNHLRVYAGNDGGIYRSDNGGTTWTDRINHGICITQFEFIDNHPTSDSIVIGGTQDNGTQMYRSSTVFHHADDGDGGCALIHDADPRRMICTYYGPSPKLSTLGGRYGSWSSMWTGILGNGLFYPPVVSCDTAPARLAVGTDRLNLDNTEGSGGWPTKITLPGISGVISAIHYVNANLIYAATTSGRVYRATFSAGTWTPTLISAAPLPGGYIWDVVALPGATNTVIVAMSGFGIAHVWRGVVPSGTGPAVWTDVSGSGLGRLPDIPANALVVDPAAPLTNWFVATDIAVFRTTNAGTNWTPFSDGLPNCAVFDLKFHGPSRTLRAATHGRGLWERSTDLTSSPPASLVVRDHIMDTGRSSPSPVVTATTAEPLQQVSLGMTLNYWMCADIKVDALEGATPAYQMPVSDVDYIAFESRLANRNPQRGRVNRVYVQVHNNGYAPAGPVRVKLLWTYASTGYPNLPPDFWTAFPNNSTNVAVWRPIGAAKSVASIPPGEPVVLEWDWTPPATAPAPSGAALLVVVDSVSDPIPAANKSLVIGTLVPREKRVGLRAVTVVAAVGPIASESMMIAPLAGGESLVIDPVPALSSGQLSLLFAKGVVTGASRLEGLSKKRLPAAMRKRLQAQHGDALKSYDTSYCYTLSKPKSGATADRLSIPKAGAPMMIVVKGKAKEDASINVTHVGKGKRVIGGTTIALTTANY